jgi:hypothetical protein
MMRLLGGYPSLYQSVSDCEGQSEISVAVGRGISILGQSPSKVALEILPHAGWR